MKTPNKPAKVKVKTGFQALTGLNTSGAVRPIPHTASAPATMNYERKNKLAGLRSSPRRGKKMY